MNRTIAFPDSQVQVEKVRELLRKATARGFWPPGESDQETTIDVLARWILEEQQAFKARSQPNPDLQQDSPSAAEAHGVAIEATPYSKDEPGKYMAIDDKKDVVENIELLSWKVCTMNGKTFEIGWTFSREEKYTTCTVTLKEPVTTRKHIRDKFPAKDGSGFWLKELFEPNSLCGTYRPTIAQLTSMIIHLRGIYGLPIPKP